MKLFLVIIVVVLAITTAAVFGQDNSSPPVNATQTRQPTLTSNPTTSNIPTTTKEQPTTLNPPPTPTQAPVPPTSPPSRPITSNSTPEIFTTSTSRTTVDPTATNTGGNNVIPKPTNVGIPNNDTSDSAGSLFQNTAFLVGGGIALGVVVLSAITLAFIRARSRKDNDNETFRALPWVHKSSSPTSSLSSSVPSMNKPTFNSAYILQKPLPQSPRVMYQPYPNIATSLPANDGFAQMPQQFPHDNGTFNYQAPYLGMEQPEMMYPGNGYEQSYYEQQPANLQQMPQPEIAVLHGQIQQYPVPSKSVTYTPTNYAAPGSSP